MAPSLASVVNSVWEQPLPLPSLEGERLTDILRLIRTPGIGPVMFFQLLRRYGSMADAIAALPELSARGGRKTPLVAAAPEDIEKEIVLAQKFGARFIRYGETEYPPLLHMIPDPPPVLTIMGNTQLWQRQSVGVVGARNASANGCAFAQKISSELGQAGTTIVSGLARGIDTYAHKGALATGTVAVIASGIDLIYPPENEKLTKEIRERGAVVTEQPFGQAPFAAAFPGRNRIIAGISQGTLIVEAAPKSGSLITARLANEQGRDVFAVPGHPLDPRAQGCNRLIKSGAQLVEEAADILHALALPRTQDMRELPLFDYTPETLAEPAPELQERVLAQLSPTPVSIDYLRAQCQVTPGALFAALMELELAGRILRVPGGTVCLNSF